MAIFSISVSPKISTENVILLEKTNLVNVLI